MGNPAGQAWPLISVVIPSLNQCAFLEDAIRSVLLQEYPRLELIVMDGGSTDGTLAVLEEYAPRLTHWVSAPDTGPAMALNRGFEKARGDLYAVLNADDYYLPGALAAVAHAFASDPSADVMSGHGYFASASGELGVATFSDSWSARRFRHGTCVLVQPATFFRREAFERAGGFRTTGRVCWDMELWADMSARGARFRTMASHLAAFRLHDGSITGRADLGSLRRRHAREVQAEMRGRPESAADRVLHLIHRLLKFARHPGRTIRQRMYFHSVLKRWTL